MPLHVEHGVAGTGDAMQPIAQTRVCRQQAVVLAADANGPNGDLHVGTTLILPNPLGGNHNDSAEFRPYDAGRVVEGTTPDWPAPVAGPGGGADSGADDCGGLGHILLIVAANVLSYVAAVAAAGGQLRGNLPA